MFRFLTNKSSCDLSSLRCLDPDGCREFLNEQLDFIARICEKAASKAPGSSGSSLFGDGGTSYLVLQQDGIDADELFIQVVDHLREDNYRRLREFEGRSAIATYLTTIVSRLVVDVIRKRTGRSRAKERAERQGELGGRIYDLMVGRGHTADEAAHILQTTFAMQVAPDQVREIHASFFGRDVRYQSPVSSETAWGEEGELVVICNKTPEDELSFQTAQKSRQEVLSALIDGLKGEERLLLRLRFPLDDDAEPRDLAEISHMVGLSPQQADRKIRRILQRFREELLRKGIRFDDLV